MALPLPPHMLQLHIGLTKEVNPVRPCLFIHDEVPEISSARVFDPTKHSFNLLKDISYKTARTLADGLYTINPQGETTLKVRDGKRALLRLLRSGAARLDDFPSPRETKDDDEKEALATIADLLQSDILSSVLCGTREFDFAPNQLILARINRAELGDFDALVLGLFLMSQFQGQIVVPDFGFYGRDAHVSLIRENRLVAGINSFREVRRQERLHDALLLIPDKQGNGTTFKDAQTLADYARIPRGTNAFNAFIDEAMA